MYRSEETAAKVIKGIFAKNEGAFADGVHIIKEKIKQVRVFKSARLLSELKRELTESNSRVAELDEENIDSFIARTCTEITATFLDECLNEGPKELATEPQEHASPSVPGGKCELPYVFISYAHEDTKIATQISKILEAYGIPHFLDLKEINWGSKIARKVRASLKQCTHQIIVFSPATDDSSWVHYECGNADGGGKILLPYLTHKRQRLPGYLSDTLTKHSMSEVKHFFQKLAPSNKKLALEKVGKRRIR